MKTLNQWIVLGLAAGYMTLMADIRYDHNHVLEENAIAWTPIVFSSLMAVVCVITLALWNRRRPVLLTFLSAAGIAVGLLGFWLHNQGHPISGIHVMLSVWTGNSPDPLDRPPVLAPLSFAGLGLLGIVACSKRQAG